MSMKRYEVYSNHTGPDEIEEHPEGDWVPAEVAQGIYDALNALVKASDVRAIRGSKHVPSMRDEQDARSAAKRALKAADEGKNHD